MNLASPLDLLWLLPVAGGIIALWMLRVRRKEQVVSSLFLWRRVTPAVKADTPLQKLRRNILLFLQLLAAFLLVLALTHPMLRASAPSGVRYAVIIDDSASLAASDISPNRLAASVDKLRGFLHSSVRPGDRLALIVSAGPPRLAQAWTAEPARVESAADSIAPTDIERDLPSAVTLARTQIGRKSADARIVIFSDGAWDTSEDDAIKRAAGPVPIAMVPSGTDSASNVGIVGIDSRRDPFQAGARQVFVRIGSFSAQDEAGTVTLSMGGHALGAQAVSLAAGGSSDITFSNASLTAGGIVTARLTGFSDDRLASDNIASLVLPPERRERVLLVSAGSLFLEKGLALDPNVDLFETTPDQYGQIHGRYDLTVFDDFSPASLAPGNYLIFHAAGSGMPVVPLGADTASPAIVDWVQTDPLMRFVDLTDVHIASAAPVRAADWGRTVVDSDGGPLIVSGERFGRRCVWVAFTPQASDFPLKVSFPIFLTNAMQWLSDSAGASSTVHPGAPIILPAGAGDWRVKTDAAEPAQLTCTSNSPCSYGDTEHAGIYRFWGKPGQLAFAADVASERASQIASRDHPVFASRTDSPAASGLRRVRTDIWQYVLAAVLCLLVAEWAVYHRAPPSRRLGTSPRREGRPLG